jgi:hypothetical protein
MSTCLDDDLVDADDWADDTFWDVLADVLSEDHAVADLDDLEAAAEAMLGALSPADDRFDSDRVVEDSGETVVAIYGGTLANSYLALTTDSSTHT